MWKIIIVALALAGAYLFVPRYDLLKRESMLSHDYHLVKEGFWRDSDCRKAGREFEAGFKCLRHTAWQNMLGKQYSYSQQRDVQF